MRCDAGWENAARALLLLLRGARICVGCWRSDSEPAGGGMGPTQECANRPEALRRSHARATAKMRALVRWSWSAGVLECWSAEVLECWSAGALECWSAGVRVAVPAKARCSAGYHRRRAAVLERPSMQGPAQNRTWRSIQGGLLAAELGEVGGDGCFSCPACEARERRRRERTARSLGTKVRTSGRRRRERKARGRGRVASVGLVAVAAQCTMAGPATVAGMLQCCSGRACRARRENAPDGRSGPDYGRQSLGGGLQRWLPYPGCL